MSNTNFYKLCTIISTYIYATYILFLFIPLIDFSKTLTNLLIEDSNCVNLNSVFNFSTE